MTSIGSFILLPDVWKVLQKPSLVGDIEPSLLPHFCCILFGTLASYDNSSRVYAAKHGALKIAASILMQSSEVIGPGDSLLLLRRVSEQAILQLLSGRVETTITPFASQHFMTSNGYATDTDLLLEASTPFSIISDLLASTDAAVSARAVRVIAILVR